jgi:3' terminal RNA ribose 2'-O-methyltransferase Hen1
VLLTLTTTYEPATDLGYLLHKHPDRVQSFDVSAGVAHVFYPESTDERCTVALLLEVDPIELVRGRKGGAGNEGFALGQYVNDRPYASSSMLAVALGKVFRSALAGRCDARPDLAMTKIPLDVRLPAAPCRGGAEMATRLFAPLGWDVSATPVALDERFPQWGDSRYVTLRLTGTQTLAEALTHLYVLLPAMDGAKHYWMAPDEVDKLLRAGGGWLAGHPERELITRRYLAHRRPLVTTALARLADADDATVEAIDNAVATDADADDRPPPLNLLRHRAVLAVLRSAGAHRVIDLGCGDGAFLGEVASDATFTDIAGTDVSYRALEIAARRLRLDRLGERQRERFTLFQSALTYRDERFAGYDAAVLMEVVEHVDLPRLPALERVVFGHARPATVVVTTPNVEYNARYPDLPAGTLRHRDHRFEWTRAEFARWADDVATTYGYDVRHLPVGDADPDLGAPTQLAVFTRGAA